MKTNTRRSAIRGKRSAPKKRLVLNPPTKRTALLSGTALAGGVLVALAVVIAAPRPAMAQQFLDNSCIDNPANFYTCAGPEDVSLTFEPDGTFQADFGPDTDNPFTWNGSQATPAVTIDAGGNSTEGNGVHFYPNSLINNEGGIGLHIFDINDVVVNIDDAMAEGDDPASITGTIGILVNDLSEGGLDDTITINNFGHIEGTEGAAIDIAGIGIVNINNHTFASSVGATNGDVILDADSVNVNNREGLTAGLGGDGLNIFTVSGDGLLEGVSAVRVFNNALVTEDDVIAGGVFAGSDDGISTELVNGGIRIENQAAWDTESETFIHGGLIAGVESNGVQLWETEGDIFINNNLTRQGMLDLTSANIDALVSSDGGLLTGVLPAGFTTGIYGFQDGVEVIDLSGDLGIWNRNGQIVGEEGHGIDLFDIAGIVEIDNSAISEDPGFDLPGGTIWGGTNGINGALIDVVAVLNEEGVVFGVQNGVNLSEGGLFEHFNPAGLTWGYYGDGINVSSYDKVGIWNGGGFTLGEDGPWQEGHIIGGDRAIYAAADKVGVFNAPGGAIIGDGQQNIGDFQPVMQFLTSGDSEDGPFGLDAGAWVFSGGIMGSHNNPHFDRPWDFPDVNEVPAYTLDTAQIVEDTDSIAAFATSGGVFGSIDKLGAFDDLTIADYQQTASDLLIYSEGGALFALSGGIFDDFPEGDYLVEEEAIMFGRIQAFGQTEGEIFDENEGSEGEFVPHTFGNTVVNLGKWFTTNNEDAVEPGSAAGNILLSEGEDTIYNLGFTQTAFGMTEDGDPDLIGDYTSFLMDDFYNGGGFDFSEDGPVLGGEGGYGFYRDGWLSLVDGDPDDVTYMFGNFHGSHDLDDYRSYLALDVNFHMDVGRSDFLDIGDEGGDLFGSTEVVVNKLNTETSTTVGTEIPFAHVSNDFDAMCVVWCAEGDPFFVSALDPNYVNVDGIGFVRDGFFMWGVQESETESTQYAFVADWGPDSYDQPVLITAAQNAWYETGGVVEDHIYGNTYPGGGAGGSGADLIYDPVPPPGAAPKGHGTALWGRVTGNWANRDTQVEVDDGIGVVTFDTGLNQNTYSILGGIELRPGAGESGVRLGAFGGYLTSSATFDSYGGTASYSGGTVGGYAALTSGGAYVDAEVKGDFLSVNYVSPSVDITTPATSIGVLANAGYRMESGNSFVEPIASFGYVHTALGTAMGGGATVTYSNGTSIRAGAGGRIGTSFGGAGGTMTELSLLGKVWNEFGAPNMVTISDGVTTETFTDSISGVFGDVSGMATVYSVDRMTSGFVSAGAKFGSGWTSVSAKAGVRRGF